MPGRRPSTRRGTSASGAGRPRSSSSRHAHGDVVEVQHLGALVEQHALGQAGRAAGVHEHDGVVLVGLVGDLRRRRLRAGPRRRCRGGRRRSPMSTTCSMPAACAHLATSGAKAASTKQTSVPESRRMYSSSAGASRRLSGLHDARAQEGRVVELEVVVAVERHDGEAVVRPTPSSFAAPSRGAPPGRCAARRCRGSRRRRSRPCRRTATPPRADGDGRRAPSSLRPRGCRRAKRAFARVARSARRPRGTISPAKGRVNEAGAGRLASGLRRLAVTAGWRIRRPPAAARRGPIPTALAARRAPGWRLRRGARA